MSQCLQWLSPWHYSGQSGLPRQVLILIPKCVVLLDSQSDNEASPVKRPRLLESTERPEESGRSKQKSRRRCFQCQTKLELVQQELGSCRCGEHPSSGTFLIPCCLRHGCCFHCLPGLHSTSFPLVTLEINQTLKSVLCPLKLRD